MVLTLSTPWADSARASSKAQYDFRLDEQDWEKVCWGRLPKAVGRSSTHQLSRRAKWAAVMRRATSPEGGSWETEFSPEDMTPQRLQALAHVIDLEFFQGTFHREMTRRSGRQLSYCSGDIEQLYGGGVPHGDAVMAAPSIAGQISNHSSHVVHINNTTNATTSAGGGGALLAAAARPRVAWSWLLDSGATSASSGDPDSVAATRGARVVTANQSPEIPTAARCRTEAVEMATSQRRHCRSYEGAGCLAVWEGTHYRHSSEGAAHSSTLSVGFRTCNPTYSSHSSPSRHLRFDAGSCSSSSSSSGGGGSGGFIATVANTSSGGAGDGSKCLCGNHRGRWGWLRAWRSRRCQECTAGRGGGGGGGGTWAPTETPSEAVSAPSATYQHSRGRVIFWRQVWAAHSPSVGKPVRLDGVACTSRLSWLAHTLGHEMLHALLFNMCGKFARDAPRNMSLEGHGHNFLMLNWYVLGHRGYTYNPRGWRPPPLLPCRL